MPSSAGTARPTVSALDKPEGHPVFTGSTAGITGIFSVLNSYKIRKVDVRPHQLNPHSFPLLKLLIPSADKTVQIQRNRIRYL